MCLAANLKNVGLYYPLRAVGLKERLANIFLFHPKRKHWVFRDLNFSVKKGESVSVLGENGVGKSTMMRVLAGILPPDEGKVLVNGSARLLSAKAGLNPTLTGRSNIRLASSFIGIKHKQLPEKEKEIIEFSELGDYIDQPIRSYSSGMKARLSFAIATSVTTDILLIDEGLAVGDVQFKAKAQKRIEKILGESKTVIIVTHQLSVAREMTERSVVINNGEICADDSPFNAILEYKKIMNMS